MIPRKELTVTSASAGHYERGEYVDGVTTQRTIKASLQPIRGKELQQRFENENVKQAYTLYTNDDLETDNIETGTVADLVKIGNNDFKVYSVEDWQNTIINHKKVTVVRLESGK